MRKSQHLLDLGEREIIAGCTLIFLREEVASGILHIQFVANSGRHRADSQIIDI